MYAIFLVQQIQRHLEKLLNKSEMYINTRKFSFTHCIIMWNSLLPSDVKIKNINGLKGIKWKREASSLCSKQALPISEVCKSHMDGAGPSMHYPHEHRLQLPQSGGWLVQQSLPSTVGPSSFVFLCHIFQFGIADLLNGLTKADGDELEFLVGLTILILCHSYNRHMNQIYLH